MVLFSVVDSFAFQFIGIMYGMNMFAMAFDYLISSCGRYDVSYMTLRNQISLTKSCHYILFWSFMVINKYNLPTLLLEWQ